MNLIDRLIIKITLNIENDNQEKVESYFKEYMDSLNGNGIMVDREEHNKVCLAYINYQVGKSEEENE